MLAQAEHDIDASAILLTTSKRLAQRRREGNREAARACCPPAKSREKSIDKNSAIILVKSIDEAVELSNRFAPEHLSIPDASSACPASGTRAASSSARTARKRPAITRPARITCCPPPARRGCAADLSAADYVKVISTQEVSPDALRRLAPAITTLARAEGLEAHARSVEVRFTGRSNG